MAKRAEDGGIGMMGEHSLHAALKAWYARPGDRLEEKVEGYLIDIVRDDLLIEIQTRSFSAVRKKLTALLANHPVRLVHPIPREKWFAYLSEDGLTETGRRKSPQRLGLVHVFLELVHIPDLMRNPNLSIEVLVTREEEVRREAPRGLRRRRRTVKFDRRLISVEGQRLYRSAADFRSFLPDHLEQPFTTRDLSEAIGEPLWLAEKITYCLRHVGAVREVGKRRNAILYAV